MGVHGLWGLLAPVGRRVSVETLSGKKLAIDASIWIVQFMKAMRDESGEMVRNGHLMGFFRRICKLLFLRTKPVFVFDGATPALKRRTVVARRRLKENAQAKIRKTAEKLLLNHLKAMRLKELAKDLENQRKKQKDMESSNEAISEHHNREKVDEMLAASIAAEENGSLDKIASTSAAGVSAGNEDTDDEEIILAMDGKFDPAVLAALPPSMQLDLLMRESSMEGKRKYKQEMKQDQDIKNVKGKEILSDDTDLEEINLQRDELAAESYTQEKLDEMLAASIAAEEDASLNKNASTSGTGIPSEEEGGDEDEEMILPSMPGKVDPAVLAALPPSMQLDLLVQMRERLMAENRQRYQKVKKAPEKFSELQIEAYLKTVAFRREIDQVQKAAAGQGVGGVQTSRIASEANREFIFSSSFTGDKKLFMSDEVQRNEDMEQQAPRVHPVSGTSDNVTSIDKSNSATGLVLDESRRVFDDDVETYLDERGRIRVSRVRAMGMRMTRDLQRNLDLMKEIEQERTHPVKTASAQSAFNGSNNTASVQPTINGNKINTVRIVPIKSQHVRRSDGNTISSVNLTEKNGESILNNRSSIQVSFKVDGESKSVDSDDDIFSSLVSGEYMNIAVADNSTSTRQPPDSVSDSDWEEGIIEGKVQESYKDVELGSKLSLKEGNIGDDSEMEWEEGGLNVSADLSCLDESGKSVSKGHLEEEADLQEAIRRSLEDLGNECFNHTLFEKENVSCSKENAFDGTGLHDRKDNNASANLLQDSTEQNRSYSDISRFKKLDGINSSEAFSSPGEQYRSSEAHNTGKSCERFQAACSGQSSMHNVGNLCGKTPSSESVGPSLLVEINPMEEPLDSFIKDDGLSTFTKMPLGDSFHISKTLSADLPHVAFAEDKRNDMQMEPSMSVNEEQIGFVSKLSGHSVDRTRPSIPFMESCARDSINDVGTEQELAGANSDLLNEKEHGMDKSGDMNDDDADFDFTETTLEEEILNLGQERLNLGNEQRKLERNAESVSSEMFAECQELLQMFGLPYIIAPMEAEAQCAYMELANLVDGVVTDDSDVFLFGAQSVYKNIFDDRKYVETYFMKDIEKELGLTREKLIRMAMLLGSDYTEGVSGIGIVNAIEVVNAFPEEDGLQKFREWIESPDPTILGKCDVQTGLGGKKKGSKVGENNLNCTSSSMEGIPPLSQNTSQVPEEQQSTDHIREIKQTFMDKHRNVSKNWHIPSSFPSEAVISAYICPQVDKSTEPFSWGKPDLHLLRRLCWEKFGWAIQKSDDLLLPVLKEYNKHETQLRMEAFYTFNERFAKIRSKRIKKAVKGITGNQSADVMDDTVKEVSKSRKGKKISPDQSVGNKSRKISNRVESIPGTESYTMEISTTERSRKRRSMGKPVSSEVENSSPFGQAEGRQHLNKGSNVNGRGKGRRRGRAQGTGGREKGYLGSEQSDSSSGDVNTNPDTPEIHVERPREVRRSTRSRKPVNYAFNDMEIDDADMSLNEGNIEGSFEKVTEEDPSRDEGVCKDSTPGHDEKEQRKVEDPSLEGFSSNYLETGNGFRAEGETGHPGGSQCSHPFETDVSKDYLEIGGGFCADEIDKCEDEQHTSPAKEPVNASYVSGFTEEVRSGRNLVQSISGVERATTELPHGGEKSTDTDLNADFVNATLTGDQVKVSSPPRESNRNNSKASNTLGSLRAMPLLKRKRRKS